MAISSNYTDLLLKKYLGVVETSLTNTFASEAAGNARPSVFTNQIYNSPIPNIAPKGPSLLNSSLTTIKSSSSTPDLVFTGYVSDSGSITSTPPSTISFTNNGIPLPITPGIVYTSKTYPYIQYIQNLPLYSSGLLPGTSYRYTDPTSGTNILQNMIPFNYDPATLSYTTYLYTGNGAKYRSISNLINQKYYLIDCDAGYLMFIDGDYNENDLGSSPLISFYRYNGTIGIPTNLGSFAGSSNQNANALAYGDGAGQYAQGTGAIAIGYGAGQYSQGTGTVGGRGAAIAIGYQAGVTGQNTNTVAIGFQAGGLNQATGSVAIGYGAGSIVPSSVTGSTGSAYLTSGNNPVSNSFLANTFSATGFNIGTTGVTGSGPTSAYSFAVPSVSSIVSTNKTILPGMFIQPTNSLNKIITIIKAPQTINAIVLQKTDSNIIINSEITANFSSINGNIVNFTYPSQIVLSTNGQYQLGSIGSYLYLSTNSGVTFNAITSLNGLSTTWVSIAMSGNAQYMIAYYYNEAADTFAADKTIGYISSNYGSSWSTINTNTIGVSNISSISISYTGQYIIAVGGFIASTTSYLSVSSNYGASFTKPSTFSTLIGISWVTCSMSFSGQYMLAATQTTVYLSTNFGGSFKAITSLTTPVGISSSTTTQSVIWYQSYVCGNGQYMIVTTSSYTYWISSDYGSTWKSPIPNTFKPVGLTTSFNTIALSENGQHMIGTYTPATTKAFYISRNYGASFGSGSPNSLSIIMDNLSLTTFITGLAMSSDSKYIAIATTSGFYSVNTNAAGNSVALGYQAGQINQSLNTVAIGTFAGQVNQHANTIVLNASGTGLNTSINGGLFAAPINPSSLAASAGVGLLGYSANDSQIVAIPAMFDSSSDIIALGNYAGSVTGTTNNSIVLNASGTGLFGTGPTGGFYVAPVGSYSGSTGPFTLLAYGADRQIVSITGTALTALGIGGGGGGGGSSSTLTVSSNLNLLSGNTGPTGMNLVTDSIAAGSITYFDGSVQMSNIQTLNYAKFGQTWTQASTLSNNWYGVAMSSSGQYQTASTYGKGLYTSTNFGQTWTQVSSGAPTTNNWNGVAISSSGQYQTACTNSGQGIYISINYGQTWTQQFVAATTNNWNGVAMSSSGQYQTACAINGQGLYTSTNYGQTWTSVSTLVYTYRGVAMSSSGQYQTACTNAVGLYISTNYGQTWTQALNDALLSLSNSWKGVAMSSSGQYQTACASNGQGLYTSTNYGQTWTQASTLSNSWYAVAMTSSGQYQTVCAFGVGLYISTNFGQAWTLVSTTTTDVKFGYGVSISSSGQYQTVFTNFNGGKLYTSVIGSIQNIPPSTQSTGPFTLLAYGADQQVVALTALGIGEGGGGGSSSTLTVSSNMNLLSGNTGPTGMNLVTDSIAAGSVTYFDGSVQMSNIQNLNYANFGKTWTQVTTASGAPTTNTWYAVAMSSSGQYQTSCANGQLYLSTNYGQTWTQVSSLLNSWSGIAMSSSGQYQTSCTSGQGLYLSTNYGQTWTQVLSASGAPTTIMWSGVAMSSSGQYQAACAGANGLYLSTNYGQTWTQVSSLVYIWSGIAMSSSGQYQTSCTSGQGLHLSTNYGQTWTQVSTVPIGNTWQGIAISSSGQYQLASTTNSQGLFISTNFGKTWTQVTSAPITNTAWYGVAMSSSGQYQTACAYGKGLYISTNFGLTWTVSSSLLNSWYGVAMSSSGQYQTSCTFGGQGLYTSVIDYGIARFSSLIMNDASIRTLSGDSTSIIFFPTSGAGLCWGSGYSRIIDNGDLCICTDDSMHFYTGTSATTLGTIFMEYKSADKVYIYNGLTVSGGSIDIDNGKTFRAKNSAGIYEDFLWPRYSDDIMYLNYGSAGFRIRKNNSDDVVAMDTTGNVGIGTSTPAYKLDVSGTIRGSSLTVTSKLGIGTASPTAPFHVYLSGGVAGWDTFKIETTSCWGDGNTSWSKTSGTQYITFSPVMFQTPHIVADSDGVARMRFGRAGGVATGKWWEIAVKANGTYRIGSEGGDQFIFNSSGDFSCTGDITAFGSVSDVRLKKNVKTLESSLEIIKSLNPVTFTWKEDIYNEEHRNTNDVGFIAQEVEQVIPMAVGEFKVDAVNEVYKKIKHERIVPYVVKSVQELSETVNQQKEEINNLKQENDLLKSQLSKLLVWAQSQGFN